MRTTVDTGRNPSTARRPLLPLLALPFLALSVFACGDGSPTEPESGIDGLPRSLSVSEKLLVGAGNDFAFRFLDRLYDTAPDSNLFAAPLSASMALGMTLNGAEGNTLDEMRSTLGYRDLTLDQINQGYRDLTELLVGLDPEVELAIGNSIWYREGFPVRSDFLDRTRSFFGAEVQDLDFSDPGAAGVINGWVKDQTNGKIKEIVESPIDWATVMFLINAVYFKGSWTHRFPAEKTADAAFTAWDGSRGTLPLMQLADTLLYTQNDVYQAVDLPYGGRAYSMTVLLPREGHTVRDVITSLDAESWARMVGSMHAREGTVFLPRFKVEWEKVLNGTLKAMGMVDAFAPGVADFTGISNVAKTAGLFISKVKQKTYVDVNEEGTEASGVTSVEIRLTAASDHFTFRADRPFVFFIRERFSETILFAGVLLTPMGG